MEGGWGWVGERDRCARAGSGTSGPLFPGAAERHRGVSAGHIPARCSFTVHLFSRGQDGGKSHALTLLEASIKVRPVQTWNPGWVNSVRLKDL